MHFTVNLSPFCNRTREDRQKEKRMRILVLIGKSILLDVDKRILVDFRVIWQIQKKIKF